MKYTIDNISYYDLIQHIGYYCIICHWCDGKYKIYHNIREMGKCYRYTEKNFQRLSLQFNILLSTYVIEKVLLLIAHNAKLA